jgi:hypothetical protein
MKRNLVKVFLVSLVLVFATSCLEDDYSKQIEEWKTENDTYFINMKDSSDYQSFTLPAEQGGGLF